MIDWEDEDFNRRLLQIYKVTSDPLYCGWILPDGRMLNFIEGENGLHIMNHRFVEFVLEQKGENAITEFASSGAIRHQHTHNAVFIIKRPTDAQMPRLADVFKCHYRTESWINGRTTLHMLNEFKSFFEYYQLGTNPSHIMADVRRFFGITE